MNANGCNGIDHVLSRRHFLAGVMASAGMFGFRDLLSPANADTLSRDDKRVLVIFLAGGVSQLESWDPKPGTDTGGPFRAIGTSVPGVQISELLPFTALQMHRMSIVRSVNTKEDDHGKGAVFIETGRREMPGQRYPTLGSAV